MIRFCPKHGRQTRVDAKYCPDCGAMLKARRKAAGKWLLALVALGAAIWIGFLQPRGGRVAVSEAEVILPPRESAKREQHDRRLANARQRPAATPSHRGAPSEGSVGSIKVRHYDRPLPSEVNVDVYPDPSGVLYAIVPVAHEKLTTINLGREWTFKSVAAEGEHRVDYKEDKDARTIQLWGKNSKGNSALVYLERR